MEILNPVVREQALGLSLRFSFLPFSPSLYPSLFSLILFLVQWEGSNTSQTTQIRIPDPPLTNHLILEIFHNLSEPQIPHLLNGGDNGIYLIQLLGLSNGLIMPNI